MKSSIPLKTGMRGSPEKPVAYSKEQDKNKFLKTHILLLFSSRVAYVPAQGGSLSSLGVLYHHEESVQSIGQFARRI